MNRTLLMVAGAALALATSLSEPASALSCQGLFSKCVAGCTAEVRKQGAPAGCTCKERYNACLATGTWKSWRGGIAYTGVSTTRTGTHGR